ncbi:MAG: hypothetical protein WC397_04505 [Candidatus Paceibacterota bacterium]|jgi:hypothetical protein
MKPVRSLSAQNGVGHVLNLGYKIVADPKKKEVIVYGGRELNEYRITVTASQVTDPLLGIADQSRMEIYIKDGKLVCILGENGSSSKGEHLLAATNGKLDWGQTSKIIGLAAEAARA